MQKIGNDWDAILSEEFEKDYYISLREFLQGEYSRTTVFPPAEDIFNAFKYTSFADTKVVILGQDPYHEPGQAHGLAFSVPKNIPQPPSLRNILIELRGTELSDENEQKSRTLNSNDDSSEGILVPWARQGVLLLNTVLTVRAHEAASHRDKGWEKFTDAVIRKLAAREKPVVFILWGAAAGRKKELILEAAKDVGTRHLIITAPHPSPLSAYRGFFGGRYFDRANYFIEDNGGTPIDWRIES